MRGLTVKKGGESFRKNYYGDVDLLVCGDKQSLLCFYVIVFNTQVEKVVNKIEGAANLTIIYGYTQKVDVHIVSEDEFIACSAYRINE